MDKNKSIDGLASRSAKVAVSKSPKNHTTKATKSSKPAEVKKAPVKPIPSPAPTPETTAPKATPAPATPAKTKKSPKPQKAVVADFLNPVQAFNFDEKSGELTATKKPIKKDKTKSEKSPKPQKTKKHHGKAFKITIGIIITILSLLLIAAITFLIWGDTIIKNITGGQGNVFDLLTFMDDTYEPLKTASNGRTNILAFGTSGYNMEGDEGRGKHDGSQLTDSIMVISLDQETGDIAMLSLPRDLKASPTCTATGKINEVYWCNNQRGDNEQAGASALMAEVSNILGLDFQYYVHLNWGSLVSIVDTLGGITINLDEGIYDYYYTKAVFEPGVDYVINGSQALGLARARHGTTSGDFSRGASQQKILIGIKNKLLEKDLSVTDMVSLANTLGDNLRSNFSVSELKSLAHLTADFDFDAMRQVSLITPTRYMTTGTINGISYVIPSSGVGNYGNIQSYVAKMLSSDPRAYEETSILVLNGTDEAGLAATEQTTLKDEGYKNIYTDNAPEGEYHKKYTLYALNNANPGTRRLLEEKYHTTAKSYDDLPEGASKDYNFVIILGEK